jgi:hypothetical protein
MSDTDSLYEELKDHLQTVADPLFDFACQQVTKLGAFLPVGAKMTADGETELVAAAPKEDVTSSDVVLPLLVAALQQSATDAEAVALCEWVKIEVDGGKARDAVKVHAHHKRGLAVAFYLPATKTFWRGWQFGEMMVKPAEKLVETWPCADA